MNTFFVVFIALPALEIFLMIKIGAEIGALNTVAIIFLTAIIGIYYARIQGIQTLRSGIINLYQNKVPINELISGASIAIAALLLIVPGFFTDLIGFFLLIPVTRNFILKSVFKNSTSINNVKKNSDTIDGEIVNKDKDEL
mgnify:FL=1|tara:strand:- start:163 stop:585 length:423 start_codon:yes stop_codon:yes gene_type:complete